VAHGYEIDSQKWIYKLHRWGFSN